MNDRYASQPQNLAYFQFLGRLLGKALFEGILIEASFAPFFLSKWLGKPTYCTVITVFLSHEPI